MNKWEYTWVIVHPDLPGVRDKFNMLGSEGWEMFAVVETTGARRIYYFKRQVTPLMEKQRNEYGTRS